jgi:hypothetical protein
MFALSRTEGLDQGIAYRASQKARQERAFASDIQEKSLTPGTKAVVGENIFLYCSVSSFQSSG